MKKITKITKSGDKVFHIREAGDYVYYLHNVSGRYEFSLEAEGIQVMILGKYTGNNDAIYTVKTIQNHKAPNSTSNLLIKGVFYGRSKLMYEGLVKINTGCNGSHAYQKNQNLILSPTAAVDSRPYLEIESPDVYCTHGSTTGKLNEDEVWYCQSRGLNKKKAEEILVRGFLQEIDDKAHVT